MEYTNHQPTSIQDLISYSQGQIVKLPDFSEGQPFYARLRRPSMLSLMSNGKIPNSLVITANRLFNGKGMDDRNENSMSEVLQLLEVICESAFVEPSYKELKEAGVHLTDQQYMAVFNYTQEGVKALEPFRRE
jgi:hypothetical protein|nr:MAG TPA: hypothetical protein [Caudoviricetes sp.]DAR99549.1 MAG TPA: hypothetical protein [Caudoviricetes sp.]